MTRREYQEEYNESANYPYDDTDVATETEEVEEEEHTIISDEEYGYKRALLDVLKTMDGSLTSTITRLRENYKDAL